jgi:DNA-binding MarR family transcriptional regulator
MKERERRATDGPMARAMGLELWRMALRWRRQVEGELGDNFTFTQWLVLDAAQVAIAEAGDAVSQNAVAARAEIDKMTVSQVMRTLEERGLVERGPNQGGPAYRISVTAKGRRALVDGRSRVDTASAQSLAELPKSIANALDKLARAPASKAKPAKR